MKYPATFLSLFLLTLTAQANPCPPPFLQCPNPISVPCGTPFTFTPPTAIDLCCGTNLPVTALGTTTNGICPQFVARVWQATDCRGQTTTCTQTVAIVDNKPPTFCVDPLAGNLVINPGFEGNIGCPSNFSGQIILATNWTGANGGSSDYFHPCAPNGNLSVPTNSAGSQTPHGGQAYAGIHAAYTTVSIVPPEYREYIKAPLSLLLVTGHTYAVSFHVSLSDFANKAVDNLGAYLSVTNVSSATSNALLYTPQVRNPAGSFLTNKTGWTLIQGEFVAAGGERYVTIGNFYNNAGTPTNSLNGTRDWAYYYIDDVRVAECCGPRTVECSATNLFEPPAAIDACSGSNATVTLLTGSVVSNTPCARVHRLVWQAADACGNTTTCTQLVTVVDTTPPVVSCTNKTVECGAAWTFDLPVPTDACCGDQITILPLGSTSVTNGCTREYTQAWRFTDCCNNSITCTQKVTVVDTTPPALFCPQGITVATCSNALSVKFNVNATDACDTNVLVVCVPPSGSLFLLGTNVVVCTGVDDCGNTNSCSFPVLVLPGTNFWQSFPAGFADDFTAPVEPVIRSLCLNLSHPGLWKVFDEPVWNRRFGFTWFLPVGTYLDGWLHVWLRDINCAGGPQDDTISLGLLSCVIPPPPPTWAWTRRLGPWAPDPGLQPAVWCNVPSTEHLFSLNLTNLPTLPTGSANIVPHINALPVRRLDMLVEDDTRVDSARLLMLRCPPQQLIGGLETSLTNAQLVYGPGTWTLARDAGATNFSASFDLGSADGVRLNFEKLVLCCPNGIIRLATKKQPEEDATELFRLSAFGTGLARFQLGQPPPEMTQVEVRTISNGVVVASNTLPATAGIELMRFPASASILQAGASASGNIFVVIANGTNETISCEARGVFPAGYVFPRLAVMGLDVDGIASITLGGPELATAGSLASQGTPLPWLYVPQRGPSDDPFLSAFGDAVARAENGQVALSALEAGRAAPMGFTASVAESGSNEFRALIEASFGQFSRASSNSSMTFSMIFWPNPAAPQQEEVVSVSFHYGISPSFTYWTSKFIRGGAPTPLGRVQIFNSSDVPVVEVQNPASVSVSKLPPYYWPSTGWFIDADICHRFLWPFPVTVNIDGTDYQATELRFLTGSGGPTAGAFKSLRLEATGAESLVLSRIEPGPITYRMEPPPVLDNSGVVLIRGNILGAVLQSAPAATGAWSTVFSESGEMRAKVTNAPHSYYRIKGR